MKLAKTMVVAALTLTSAAANAEFLTNWKLDADGSMGGGGTVTVNEFMDLIGASYIQTAPDPAYPAFTFEDAGAFRVAGLDSTFAAPTSAQITGIFLGTGSGTLGGAISFDTTSTFTMYSDTNFNFGSTDSIFGANDGEEIGTFELTVGFGNVDTSGIPNGQLTLSFRALTLDAGYFFDENDVDLSTRVADGLLFGFVTTNASYTSAPSDNVRNEIGGELWDGEFGTFEDTNLPPGDFYVSNNGQYRWEVVPEPGSLALIGIGLLSAFGIRRRRA